MNNIRHHFPIRTLFRTVFSFLFFLLVIAGNTQTVERNSDARIDSLIALGKASQKTQTIATTTGAHNKFRFYSEPIYPVKNISSKEFKPNKSFNEYKTELDEILDGMDSLSSRIKTLEAEISSYKPSNCPRALGINQKSADDFYNFFSGNCVSQYGRVLELYIINDQALKSDMIEWSSNCPGSRIERHDIQNCSGKTFFIKGFVCKKLDRKIVSAVKKKKVTRLLDLDIDTRKEFLKVVTGLDDNYFALKDELRKAQNLLSYAKKKYFKLFEKDASAEQFNFIGLLEQDQPNGFGYLLTKDNQIVLSGIWQNGFPVVVYEVNTYHSLKGESFFYRYRPIGKQLGTTKYCIDTQPLRYTNSGTTSFSLYIGEYDQSPSLKWTGHGSCFYDDFKDANLFFYQGYWKQSKRDGNGIYQGNGVFTGVFESDELKSGTHALTNGEKRQGEFRNWKLQGVGEVISASGTRTRGYYENGFYIKSVEQYQQDLEAERKRQEELLVIQNAQLLKSQYGEQIKEKFRKLFLKMAFSGGMSESEASAASEEIMLDIERNLIHRSLTELDKTEILAIAKEAGSEVELSLRLMNSANSQSGSSGQNGERNCSWCGRSYSGNCWVPQKSSGGSNCGASEYVVCFGTNLCCSRKCAVEKCYND
jgi:hypothetical protein